MVRGPGRRGGQGPVRRPRGRAKQVTSSPTSKTNEAKGGKFQGKLSHRTPCRNQSSINDYFSPETSESLTNGENDLEQTDLTAVRTSPRKQCVLTSSQPATNGRSPHTPHKIQLCDEESEPPTSPSCALSQLMINTPRRINKSRTRLSPPLTYNVQQNQQIESSQPTTPTKTKPNDDSVEKQEDENRPKINNGVTNDMFNGKNSHYRGCHTLSEKVSNQNIKGNQPITNFFPIRRSVRKTKKTVMEEKQKNLEDCVLSHREEGLKVINFEGKGRGVITTRKFSRGEFVVEYSGELIDMMQAKLREEAYSEDQNTGCYMYYFKYKSRQYCIDATAESGRLGRLVNHSRNGNLTTKIVSINSNPHLVLIAKDDIGFGEEVCYDYGDRSKESLKYHPWLAS